jgi:hypothetical protein
MTYLHIDKLIGVLYFLKLCNFLRFTLDYICRKLRERHTERTIWKTPLLEIKNCTRHASTNCAFVRLVRLDSRGEDTRSYDSNL